MRAGVLEPNSVAAALWSVSCIRDKARERHVSGRTGRCMASSLCGFMRSVDPNGMGGLTVCQLRCRQRRQWGATTFTSGVIVCSTARPRRLLFTIHAVPHCSMRMSTLGQPADLYARCRPAAPPARDVDRCIHGPGPTWDQPGRRSSVQVHQIAADRDANCQSSRQSPLAKE